MSLGPYAHEWEVTEQRRQELLSEVDQFWKVRNAHADDPLPEAVPSRLSRLRAGILSAISRASEGPIEFGPRTYRGDRAGHTQ